MRNLLEMIYEYQLLHSQGAEARIVLDKAERVRLMGLDRFLQGETLDHALHRRIRPGRSSPCRSSSRGPAGSRAVRSGTSPAGGSASQPRTARSGHQLAVRVAEPLRQPSTCSRATWLARRARAGPDGRPDRRRAAPRGVVRRRGHRRVAAERALRWQPATSRWSPERALLERAPGGQMAVRRHLVGAASLPRRLHRKERRDGRSDGRPATSRWRRLVATPAPSRSVETGSLSGRS